jgi:quinoprotein glucose dehydrogenase
VALIALRAIAEDVEHTPVVTPEAEVAAAAMRLPDGFSVAAVASEDKLANPVAFCFDPKGRIFVAETHRVYKGVEDNRMHMDWLDDDLAARTVADRRAFMVRRMGDQIGKWTEFSELVRLLEDRDGDGRYEWSSVFSTGYRNVEDGCAAGVLWMGDRLWFTCIPSLWELRDADGDGQAEQKRALATGFGVHVALFGHDLHGLTFGPDGKVYFSIGDRGFHVETPEGVLSNPDSGAVLRCNRDGSELEVFATGLRNPQELAFNEYGDLFTVDNNSDSGDRARLVHIVEGMQAGWRMSYQYLPDRGPFRREKIWHPQNDEQPAYVVPPLVHLSDGPSGLVAYPGTGMPARYNGAFFLCDFRGAAGSSEVREFWIKPHGATYRLDREGVFAGGVLATDCDFGPDGGFYISDWVEGWSGTGKGRIYRVASDDSELAKARAATAATLRQLEAAPIQGLLALLEHADVRVRMGAQRRLVAEATSPSVSAMVVRTAADSAATLLARLHAIWALGELGEKQPKLFNELVKLTNDNEAEVRAQAATTLGRARKLDDSRRESLGKSLVPLLADASPRVRSFAAISLGKLRHRDALPGLLAMARENDDRDPVLRHAAAFGLAGTQTPEGLAAATSGASEPERLAIVVALGRQKSPLVTTFLQDVAERVRLEAARVVWDAPIPQANRDLAAALDDVRSDNEPMLRRALAANLAERSPTNLEAVIRCASRPDLSFAIRGHAWDMVGHWASPSPRDPVHGHWRPLEPRPANEVAEFVKAALPAIQKAGAAGAMGVVVAAELGIQDAFPPLVGVVKDKTIAARLRARAMKALTNADASIAEGAIEAGLKSTAPDVRSAARQLLVERFPTRAIEPLREAAESATMPERQAAIDMLAGLDAPAAREAIGQWLGRVEDNTCPPELALNVLEAAAMSPVAAIVERHREYVARQAAAGPMAAFAASLVGGDAASGEAIFKQREALSCRRCHSLVPGEVLVGPNLADVGLRRSRSELLESIVAPNAKIAEGFQTTVLQLDTGKVVAGILRREDDKHAVLVDAEGSDIVVDLSTVEDRFEGLSAMPEDLVKQMTPRNVRDLVEFLSGLKTPPTADAAAVAGGHGRKDSDGAAEN